MKIIKLILNIITLCLAIFLLNYKNISYAQPIKTFPKVEVPNENSEASNKYAVIANFVKGKTSIKTFGNVNWQDIVDEDGESLINLVNPPESQKGKIGIVYTNVGSYEGKQLDLKITINDWSKYSKHNAAITFERNSIGHLQAGYNWVEQTWQYVDHETGNLANISGSYMTFNDLDAKQFVQFSKQTTNEIDRMYVSNDTWVDASMHNNGELRIGEIAGKEATRNDRYAMVTALFSGNTIRFKWGKDYGAPSNTMSWDIGNNYFGFSGQKPVKTEVLKPTKLIIQADNKTNTSNEIRSKNEQIRYDIVHTVPSEYIEFFYKSYMIKDDLLSELEIVGTPQIFDESDKNVTEKFINNSTESSINFQAKNETLKDSSFYGHTYHLYFDAKIKDSSNLEESLNQEGFFLMKNIAYIEKDGKKIKTNEVVTRYKPIKNSINKSIIENEKEVEEKKVRVDEPYKYRIKGVVGNSETIHDFAIEDEGEDVLSFENVKVFDKNHEDITRQGTLTIDKEKNKVKWVPNDISDIYGKTYIMEIDSKIKKHVKLKNYKKKKIYIIPNTSQFVINGKFVKSNTVNILTAVKQKTNPLNINQIQQNIKDKFRLINSNNDISNSYNDLSINFKIIKYISDIMNQNSIPTLESKYIEKQLKSSTISKEIKNETKVEKQIASNKKKDIITQTDDLPITGIDNNLTIVVLGGLLILLGLIHAFNILRRRKK